MRPAALEICENLKRYRKELHRRPMVQLFKNDANRFRKFSCNLGDLLFDYSKNYIDDHALAMLFELARAAGLEQKRDRLFAGERINETENRAVMHMALRNVSGNPMRVEGNDVMPEVRAVLARMKEFSQAVRDGSVAGSEEGAAFTDVVNIGIGGSDLGPVMVSMALRPWCNGPRLHFVSNIDGDDLTDTLAGLDPETTLFIVASKSFTTMETMVNATSARDWLVAHLGEAAVARHFVALSTNIDETGRFGIPEENTFGFWDWVGGRYSVWSAIGLSVMIAIGAEKFEEFLEGGHEVDRHFATASWDENIPVLMALIGIWHRNICDYPTHAILPYAQHLRRFPAYLQQLDMESNGKRVSLDGTPAACKTGPVVWGEPGTNGQHAFYQLLHQGSDIVPVDFLLAANPCHPLERHHEILSANCFAQSEALMVGKSLDQVKAQMLAEGTPEEEIERLAPHKVFPGNRPSNMILFDRLTPRTLGKLIALYEHKVFVQGAIWDINSFDQWGVELGKKLAVDLLPKVRGNEVAGIMDGSTAGQLAHFHRLRKDNTSS